MSTINTEEVPMAVVHGHQSIIPVRPEDLSTLQIMMIIMEFSMHQAQQTDSYDGTMPVREQHLPT